MKIKLLATALLAAMALGSSVSASAGVLNDDFDVNLTVEASCTFEIRHDIDIDLRGIQDSIRDIDPQWMLTNINQTGHAYVVCNNELPYTIEVNSGPGGEVVLVDAATSKSVPMKLYQSDKTSIWGQEANGNAIHGIGTGMEQAVEFWVGANWGYTIPVGTYTTTQVATLNF